MGGKDASSVLGSRGEEDSVISCGLLSMNDHLVVLWAGKSSCKALMPNLLSAHESEEVMGYYRSSPDV